jgi:hypothetical protein
VTLPRRLLLLMAVTLMVALGSAESAAAQEETTEGFSVEIVPNAKLLKSGAVRVDVRIACPLGKDVLEARVRVSQDEQTISGESGIPVECTGKATHLQNRSHTPGRPVPYGYGFQQCVCVGVRPGDGHDRTGQRYRTHTYGQISSKDFSGA